MNRFEKRREASVCEVACLVRSGFLILGTTFDKQGSHAKVPAKFDVGNRVSDDDAGLRFDLGKVGFCLFKESWFWLAAVALLLVVRADVIGVHVGAVGCEFVIERGVDAAHVIRGVEAQSDSALICNDDDLHASLIQLPNGFGNAGKNVELLPTGDVTAFGQFFVNNAVTIEKDCMQTGKGSAVSGLNHPVMIATE